MSGLEGAIIGAVTSQVSKTALDWLQNQGPEITEDEWKQVGYQIGIEIHSIDRQSQRNPSKIQTLGRELGEAGKIYQKLQIVGEDFDFDPEVVSLYSDLAEVCDEWASEIDFDTPMDDYRQEFGELHTEYKQKVM